MSTLPGWPHAEGPFHAGEQAVQARAGVRERMAEAGARVIRGVMPMQHRDFFPLLPFVVLGAADAQGQPWATWLVGDKTGFITSPDETHLRIDALPAAGDPLQTLVRPGASLGLLGIELPTRRRNRANGRVLEVDERGFTLQVLQSFGNCPKYIQRREALPRAAADAAPARPGSRLDAAASAWVRAADTFFIATHAPGDAPSSGSDVSHRGGRPGFVHVSDDGRTLTWPDFVGNNYFNTLGNLAAEPRAGLVFADFERGGLLHVNGRARIVWDGPELASFAGAQRLVCMAVDTVLHRAAAVPLRWRLVDTSPALDGTGVWR
jgi:predicted pyridoxine 5'-phosphate oxidase superfamily flavin-nucleotide-binding protein